MTVRRSRRPRTRADQQLLVRKLRPAILLVTATLAATILYVARAVLMPIALAILLTFLLHPLVTLLERRRLPRVAAVIVVVLAVFSVLGAVVWAMAWQATSLAGEIPRYRENLKQRISDIRGASRGGLVEEMQTTAKEVSEELAKSDQPPRPTDTPVPVVVKSEPTGLWQLPSLLEWLGSAGVVVVLVIFMLLERDELRDRVIRLIGYARLATTTRALDEAGGRISRYLLMQTIINATFGLGIGVGLVVIGVQYAVLWGFLAAVLRFIPYIGPWVAAVMPIGLSLVSVTGWLQPLLVVGLFLVLELFSNLVMEPILYGQSAGVSQVALLGAIAFWTWLWGVVGLLLATPLTVCLVVLGKHVPALEFIAVLLADQPPMAPDMRLYQRILALDQEGALRVIEEYARDHPADALYDDVIVPALNYVERDLERDRVSADEHEAMLRTVREIVDARTAAPLPTEGGVPEAAPAAGAMVLAVPARDEIDELALRLLRHLVESARCQVEIASPHLLAAEVRALVESRRPDIVCIGAVPSEERAAHTRYLCKRLRHRFPDLRIVVGRWGLQPNGGTEDQIVAAGADHLGTTLAETRRQISTLSQLENRPPAAVIPSEVSA